MCAAWPNVGIYGCYEAGCAECGLGAAAVCAVASGSSYRGSIFDGSDCEYYVYSVTVGH